MGRGRDPESLIHSISLSMPIHVSDTAATSQDGSIFRMQGAEGCVEVPVRAHEEKKTTEIRQNNRKNVFF